MRKILRRRYAGRKENDQKELKKKYLRTRKRYQKRKRYAGYCAPEKRGNRDYLKVFNWIGTFKDGNDMKKIALDLHDIFNKHKDIDDALRGAIYRARNEKVKILEIIPGKGSGQLKKRVLKFLERNRDLYDRLDKDSKNWGRLFVRFK